MDPLDLVKLTALMARTGGRPDLKIGLIDGPVADATPSWRVTASERFPGANVPRAPTRRAPRACTAPSSRGSCARRGSGAPAVCPDCTVLVRPVFLESGGAMPSARPDELARAILYCIEAVARLLNISAAIVNTSIKRERNLELALDLAAGSGVIVVVAAGNQGTLGGTAITRHPWVIPVVGYDLSGRPMGQSNLGGSIGRRGLGAPGDRVTGFGADGERLTLGGTSVATPFVTGALAPLWSEFPTATAAQIKLAATRPHTLRRTTVVPPLLNAWASYLEMRDS